MKLFIRNDNEILTVLYNDNVNSQDFVEILVNDPEAEIKENGGLFTVYKKFEKISKGFLYNTKRTDQVALYTIRVIDFNSMDINSTLQKNLVQEINKRMLRTFDLETLFKIEKVYERELDMQQFWSREELIALKNTIYKSFNQNAFQQISNRMNRPRFSPELPTIFE